MIIRVFLLECLLVMSGSQASLLKQLMVKLFKMLF